jgi:outer membrane protein assembly factor BamB
MKSKRLVFSIVALLLLTISAFSAILPITNAHTPAWTIPTYAYVVASPDHIGVGQPIALVFWLNWVPPGSGGTGGDRWRNLTVEVTKPNGDKQTLGPFISDPIGGGYSAFVPDQVGVYTVKFNFPGQVPSLIGPTGVVSVNNALWDYINDTFLPSTATTTFTVQQQQIQLLPGLPLPTNYWTRPIEGQNTNWATIASNWLGNEPAVTYNIQPNGIAPNSPHVMWVKPLQDGGVVGGTYPGVTYYEGDSYEMRFNNPMVIDGRLYYPLPLGSGQTGGGYACVDLRTGQQIWWQNWTTSLPAYGQIYDYESINQHGVLPTGILWRTTGTTMMAFDSLTATWLFNLTGVPSGNNYYGLSGEITRYVLNTSNKWLALWNNTAAHDETLSTDPNDTTSTNFLQWRPNGKNIDASKAYSWNVTLPSSIPTGSAINYVIPDDLLLCNTPTQFLGGNVAFGTIPYTVYAISLRPSTRGQILWSKQYDPQPGNITRQIGPVDTLNRVFTTIDKETMQWSAFSIDSGALVWGPVGTNLRGYTYYDSRGAGAGSSQSIYQGKLYVGGFNGLVYCYDTKNGKLLWTYGNGGPGNSTFAGLENVWGYDPTFLGGFADGKVYTMTQEHSVNTPIYQGALVRCLNATNGAEIWTLPGFASSTSFYSRLGAIADGYLSYFNTYDGQVYTIGKGPSALTVSAPQTAVPSGTKVLIQGTATDQSAGAKQKVQTGEFSSVPAMSDASMSAWMQYIYMQKPKPTNATGIKVHLTATDPNGNFQEIGNAISNTLGNYAIQWTPPVPGLYTITATFEGSNSYFGSQAGTSLIVSEAASPAPVVTPAPTQTAAPTPTIPAQTVTPSLSPSLAPQPTSGVPTTTYIAIAAAVIIIALIAAAIVLRKRK